MQSFIEYLDFIDLNEARRNSDHLAQQKLNAIEVLKKYANDPKIHITFTVLPKVGINPRSTFPDTPLAVYTYPLKSIWKDIVSHGINNVPFASTSAKYIFVLKEKEKTLDVADYTFSMLSSDLKKLERMWGSEVYKETVDDMETDAVRHISSAQLDDEKKNKSFRYLKRLLYLYGAYHNKRSRASVTMSTTLIKLGYSIVTDTKGKGFIHPAEPIQAFFLTKKSYEIVDQIDIKYVDKSVEGVRDLRARLKSGEKLSTSELKTAISQDPRLLKYVKNPSDELVIHAYDTVVDPRFSPKNPKRDQQDDYDDKDRDTPSEDSIRGIQGVMALPKISDIVFEYIASKNYSSIVRWAKTKEKKLSAKRFDIIMNNIVKGFNFDIRDIVALYKKTENIKQSDFERYIEKLPELGYHLGSVINKDHMRKAMAKTATYSLFDGDFPFNKLFFDTLLDLMKNNPDKRTNYIKDLVSSEQGNRIKIPENVRKISVEYLEEFIESKKDSPFFKDLTMYERKTLEYLKNK